MTTGEEARKYLCFTINALSDNLRGTSLLLNWLSVGLASDCIHGWAKSSPHLE